MPKIIENTKLLAELAFFAELAYQARDIHSGILKYTLPKEWKLLHISLRHAETDLHNYMAIILLNQVTKQLVISHSGTDFSSIHDMSDGFKLYLREPLDKVTAMETFIRKITPLILETQKQYGYSLITCGHSMGGVLSDLSAIMLNKAGVSVTSSITFDNPGSAHTAKHVVDNSEYINDADITCAQKSTSFVAFQGKHNLFNTISDQIGVAYFMPFVRNHSVPEHYEHKRDYTIPTKTTAPCNLKTLEYTLKLAILINGLKHQAVFKEVSEFIDRFSRPENLLQQKYLKAMLLAGSISKICNTGYGYLTKLYELGASVAEDVSMIQKHGLHDIKALTNLTEDIAELSNFCSERCNEIKQKVILISQLGDHKLSNFIAAFANNHFDLREIVIYDPKKIGWILAEDSNLDSATYHAQSIITEICTSLQQFCSALLGDNTPEHIAATCASGGGGE